MAASRFTVTTVHSEGRSVFHLVDTEAPEAEQPAIVRSYSHYLEAYKHANALNAGTSLYWELGQFAEESEEDENPREWGEDDGRQYADPRDDRDDWKS